MNTVLITGAYGFIGRYIAKEYRKNGCYVIGMGHGDWSEDEYKKWGVSQWHKCDVTLDKLILYAQQPDVIVHCAGGSSVGSSLENPLVDFERTVCSLQYVLEYIRIHSVKTKLIYPSSAAVYGNINELPIKEESLLNPISPYGVYKKISEELCLLYCQEYNLSAIVVRLFSVYGKGLRKQLLYDACRKIENENNLFWGTGAETRDWIHVKEVAKLLYMASDRAKVDCPIVNAAHGINIKIADVIHSVFDAYQTSLQPKFRGEANIGNPTHYLADIEKIKQWGWVSSISLEEGIKEYVQWYKENEKN